MSRERDDNWIQKELEEASRAVDSRIKRPLSMKKTRRTMLALISSFAIGIAVAPATVIGRIDKKNNNSIFEDEKPKQPRGNLRNNPRPTPTAISRLRN